MTGFKPRKDNQLSDCPHFESDGIIKPFKGNQRVGKGNQRAGQNQTGLPWSGRPVGNFGGVPVTTGDNRHANRARVQEMTSPAPALGAPVNHDQSKSKQFAGAALQHFHNISQRMAGGFSRCELAGMGG
jgi:hypothetical protein